MQKNKKALHKKNNTRKIKKHQRKEKKQLKATLERHLIIEIVSRMKVMKMTDIKMMH